MNTIEMSTPTRNRRTINASLSDGTWNPDEKIIHHSAKELNVPSDKEYIKSPFIMANTKDVSHYCLKNECIIPVFAKDNEKTIAHQEFIEITQECIGEVFKHQDVDLPEIRVSHQVKGRTPDAIHKSAKELLEHEKTQYFERMAFAIRIPSITETVNGNPLSLMVGGVRAYNNENLYSKKTYEKFKFFIGFQNMVCCNLCISTDGFQDEMRVGNYAELRSKISDLIENYKAEKHLESMTQLSQQYLTEHQFAQLIGRARLYNYLPKMEKSNIPELLINDGQISAIAKDYYLDKSFCRDDNGDINLWNVYNLFTSANKGSYIGSYLSRNVNSFDFTKGLAETINGGNSHHWFLS